MPSAKILDEKKQLVAELAEKLKGAAAGVLVDYKGITVEQDTAMRKEFREAGVEYAVVKNTMLKLAAKDAGISGIDGYLEGTTALAFSNVDAVIPAKIAVKYAEKVKTFEIKAGFMDGIVLDADKTTQVGKLPSKEQLIGQLLSVLTGNIRGLAVALNAIAEKESA